MGCYNYAKNDFLCNILAGFGTSLYRYSNQNFASANVLRNRPSREKRRISVHGKGIWKGYEKDGFEFS